MKSRKVIIQIEAITDNKINELKDKENWIFVPYSEFEISEIRINVIKEERRK